MRVGWRVRVRRVGVASRRHRRNTLAMVFEEIGVRRGEVSHSCHIMPIPVVHASRHLRVVVRVVVLVGLLLLLVWLLLVLLLLMLWLGMLMLRPVSCG